MFSLAVINSKSTSIQVTPENSVLACEAEPSNKNVWAHIEYSLERIETQFQSQLNQKLPTLSRRISALASKHGRDIPELVRISAEYQNYVFNIQKRSINTSCILHQQCHTAASNAGNSTNEQLKIAATLSAITTADRQAERSFNRILELNEHFNSSKLTSKEYRTWLNDMQSLNIGVVKPLHEETAHLQRLLRSIDAITAQVDSNLSQATNDDQQTVTDNSWIEVIAELDNKRLTKTKTKKQRAAMAIYHWLGSRLVDFSVAACCFMVCASLPQ